MLRDHLDVTLEVASMIIFSVSILFIPLTLEKNPSKLWKTRMAAKHAFNSSFCFVPTGSELGLEPNSGLGPISLPFLPLCSFPDMADPAILLFWNHQWFPCPLPGILQPLQCAHLPVSYLPPLLGPALLLVSGLRKGRPLCLGIIVPVSRLCACHR